MNIKQLARELVENRIIADAVKIGAGLPVANEQYCIVENSGNWEVYYAERGQKGSLRIFGSEEDACAYLLSILKQDTSVWQR